MVNIDLYEDKIVDIILGDKEYEYISYFLFEDNKPIVLEKGDFAKIQIQIQPDYPLVSSTGRGKEENEVRNHTNPKLLIGPNRYQATLYVFDENRKIKHMIDYVINVTRKKEATNELSTDSST